MPFQFINSNTVSQIVVTDIDRYRAVVDYRGSTQFFFKFETILPFDYISGKKMTIAGNTSAYPFLDSGAFGQGLKLRPKGYLSYPQSLPDSLSQFSLGFWLKPINLKPSIDLVSGLFKNYSLALIDKSNFSTNTVTGEITISEIDSTFVIYEECLEDNKNRMKILLHDGISSVILVTEPYLANQMHYFWISYYGDLGFFDVRIDGLLSDLSFELGSVLPTSLQCNPSVPFHINKSAVGYIDMCRGNSCLIDELIFQLEYVSDTRTISRHINLGSEYVLDETLAHREDVIQSFIFDDQTTIGITAIHANGSKLYMGKQNGELLKGDRTMWKTVKDFSNPAEISQIKKKISDPEGIVDFEQGALKIYKASARI